MGSRHAMMMILTIRWSLDSKPLWQSIMTFRSEVGFYLFWLFPIHKNIDPFGIHAAGYKLEGLAIRHHNIIVYALVYVLRSL